MGIATGRGDRPGLDPGAIGLHGRAPAQRPVRPGRVVVAGEAIQLLLQVGERPRGGLSGQVALERLVQALDLAAGLGVVGPRVLGRDPQPLELDLQEHLATARGGGEDGAVVAKQAGWGAVQGNSHAENVDYVSGLDGRESPRGQEQAGVVVDHVEDLGMPPARRWASG